MANSRSKSSRWRFAVSRLKNISQQARLWRRQTTSRYALTDVEKINGYEHHEVDEGKQDKDPESDSVDEIWDNLRDEAAGERKA